MKKLICVLIFGYSIGLVSQNQEKFDTIFSQWSTKDVPGVAAGLVHNGKIEYLKGFGIKNIESKEKITPQTKFMVGDLSKQFTVLSLLVLESEGKISLEDDIRKYLTQLPEYETPIRIKHLLHHSSGLNNLDPIKLLLGIRQNDVFTHEDALTLIASQQNLNFTPGTDFSYFQSDTEVILMVAIIEKATGQPFAKFCSENIFKPLEMQNTHFNNQRNPLENTAASYEIGDAIQNNPINDLTLGASNLYTTAEDLAKWYVNFTFPKEKIGRLVKKLDTYITLDSGKPYVSFWGKMTYGRYFDHPERGLKMSWQFALAGGYACNMFRYHDKNLISFVLGNNNRYNGMPAGQMASVIMENAFTEPPTIDYSKIKSKKTTYKELKKYEGYYYDLKNHLTRNIYFEKDSLRYMRVESNRSSALIPLSKNTFQMYVPGDNKILVKFYNNTINSFGVSMNDSDELIHQSFTPTNDLALQEYLGTYYNKALDLTYTFYIEENRLIVKNYKIGTREFFPLVKDKFRSNTYMLSGIKFSRDSNDNINGFSILTDGIDQLYFKKIGDNS